MKHHRLISTVLLLVLCFSCFCACPETAAASAPCEYEQRLFAAGRVHTVDVSLSEADWSDLQAQPLNKTKYRAAVTIDGETFSDVSFSTKGNSSLAAVAAVPGKYRFSFKINFGKYEKNQTYYGLNKLHLNNLFGDATHMKDYISYEMFRRLGVVTPLISYVWLSVNGSPVGLYIAVEDMSESFLDRALDGQGVLYKPESDQVSPVQQFGMAQQVPSSGGGSGSSGVSFQGTDLIYTDDNISSYSGIFDHNETKAGDADKQRVIAALKGFAENRNPAEFLDTENVIRYFAAHNFVLNGDSYTGMVPTNYFLYENNGRLGILPWDYNLAFGAFPVGMGNAAPGGENPGDMTVMQPGMMPGMESGELPAEGLSVLLNTGIDSPLTGMPDLSRPLWAWILSGGDYLSRYHDAVGELVAGYFESGDFDAQVDALYELLLPYAEKDPTAFYSAEEFARGCEMLRLFCHVRAESLRAQLDGKLAGTTAGQDSEDRIDVSGIDMQALGTPLHDSVAPPVP